MVDGHIFSFLLFSGVTLPLPITLVGQRCHWRRYNQYHRHPSPFLIRLFPQPKMFKLQTPSKLSCFYANALSPPPAITFRKIWNQSILIIFVLSHIWYSSKCPTIYCEKDIVVYIESLLRMVLQHLLDQSKWPTSTFHDENNLFFSFSECCTF